MAEADLRALRRKRMKNGLYSWAMHGLHLLLEPLPGPLRTLAWRALLGNCGRGVLIDHRVWFKFPWRVHLGDDVSINRGAEFYPGMMEKASIRVGNRVRIAPNVRLHAAGHDADHPELADSAADIVIGDDAWLGAGCIVLPGVRIGVRAVVAAGAVVSKHVDDDAVVGGVPAVLLRKRGSTAT